MSFHQNHSFPWEMSTWAKCEHFYTRKETYHSHGVNATSFHFDTTFHLVVCWVFFPNLLFYNITSYIGFIWRKANWKVQLQMEFYHNEPKLFHKKISEKYWMLFCFGSHSQKRNRYQTLLWNRNSCFKLLKEPSVPTWMLLARISLYYFILMFCKASPPF